MFWARLRSFARSVMRRSEMESNLSDELQFHLERRAEDLAARTGMTPAEAMRTARIEFGSPEKYKEETRASRGLRFVDELRGDLRFAWRSLRKNKGFAAAAIATLALGIGANTAVFSVFDAVIRDLPVPHPEQLVAFDFQRTRDSMVASYGGYCRIGMCTAFSTPTFTRFREQTQMLSHVFAFVPSSLNVVAGGDAEAVDSLYVSGDYFAGLGVGAMLGRTISPADDGPDAQPVAVISYRYWQRRLARDPLVVGKTVSVNRIPVVIVGVTPEGFDGVQQTRPVDLTLPLATAQRMGFSAAGSGPRLWWLQIMGRLAPGVTREQTLAQLRSSFQDSVRESWAARRPETPNPGRTGMPQLRVRPGGRGPDGELLDAQQTLSIVFAVVGAVLLIGCVNLANLLLVRASARRQEVAIRLTLGASRWRVVRQMLTESVLLALAGGAAGTMLAVWGKNFTQWFSGIEMPITDARIDARVMAFAVVLSSITAIVFGIGPALRATRADPAASLKLASPRAGIRRGLTSKLLLGVQVALSVMLLAGAGLLARTLYNFSQVDVGFDADNVLVFRVAPDTQNPSRAFDLYDRLVSAIEGVPGVRSATHSMVPLVGASYDDAVVQPDGAARQQDVFYQVVRWNYFETMGIPLMAGRTMNAADGPNAPRVAVINEKMAREVFGEPRPLGRHLQILQGSTRGAPIEVVGIVRDSAYQRLSDPLPPTLFVPHTQDIPASLRGMVVEVRTAGDPLAFAPAVRDAVRRVDRELPLVKLRTQRQQIGETIGAPRAFAALTAAAAAVGLLLACVGLYGIAASDAARRTMEIGIRIALGAQRFDVVRLVVRETMVVVGAGALIGLSLAAAVSRVVGSVLFGVQPGDPLTIAAALVVMIAVAAVATCMPARRAARMDPTVALRYE
jgi:predicted permease